MSSQNVAYLTDFEIDNNPATAIIGCKAEGCKEEKLNEWSYNFLTSGDNGSRLLKIIDNLELSCPS